MFDSQPRQVVITGSNTSTAKLWAISVSVAGPRRKSFEPLGSSHLNTLYYEPYVELGLDLHWLYHI